MTIARHYGFASLLAVTTAALPYAAHAAPSDPVTAAAAADDQRPSAADDIVVNGQREKATKQAADAIRFGNNVQIVDSDAIAASGASNFAELAQFLIKGANIGYSPDEGEYTIRLDGGGDRDTLVVLDGVPLYDRGPALEDIWGSTTIDPHMIDRVEIYRGGNSLFFGSNGGIGVVSLVTKRPDGTNRVELGGSYGSFNSRELWGNARFNLTADGSHGFMLYGSSQQTDGPRIFRPQDFVDNVAKAGGIQKYPLNRNNIGIKYLWQPDAQTEIRANAQYTQIEFQDPFPDNETYSPNRVRYPIVDLGATRRWSEHLYTELSAYWSNPRLNNTETFAEICRNKTGCIDVDTGKAIRFGDTTGRSTPYPNKGFGKDSKVGGFQEMGLNIRNTLTFPKLVEIVAGVQQVSYKDDSDPVFPVGNGREVVTGVYADVRPLLAFSPDTAISLAIRTDFARSFGSRTIWKAGFRQPFGDLYVRANGGTSYSLPRTNELFSVSPTQVGNPDLKTEQTKTFNGAVGFLRDLGPVQISAEGGVFWTDITNRIQGTSGLTPNTWFNNSAVTQIRGGTIDLNVNAGRALQTNISFTKQQARLAGTDLQINETPEYMIQGNIVWNSADDRLHITILPRYQGPEYATGGVRNSLRTNFGNYLVVNGSVAYWAGDKRQHRFQLRLVNILNETYAERWGYGNQRFGSAFIRGEIALNSPQYFYGYPFEGKPRSIFASYTTAF